MTPRTHPHGTPRRYDLGCREECCRRANAKRQNLRRLGYADAWIDGTGTRRRVQALRVIGWRNADIATTAGLEANSVARLLHTERLGHRVRKSTAARVRAAYDQLSMTPGPSVKTIEGARRAGWPPPLAWDDDTIDDPTATPAGVRNLEPVRHIGRGSTSAVDPVEVLDLLELGEPAAAIARRFGIKAASLQTILERAGRRDVWLLVSAAERARREQVRAA